VPPKKILIMATRPQPSPDNVPQESGGPALAPGPLTPSDMRTVFTAVDIYRSLGRLEKAVDILESTTKSNVETIQQLTQKTDQTAFAVPVIQNTIARHDKDLNELGRIAHTAKTLGYIALTLAASGIGVAILIYLYHRLAPLFFSK
jgi:hypothetical protein